MSDGKPLTQPDRDHALAHPHALRDILIAALPIVTLGVIGNLIGLSTLIGGAIINLGYVLAIIVGGFVLRQQGNSWREIGLKQPNRWWTTVLAGIGSWLGAVALFVVMQMIGAGILSALGMLPVEIDQSRFNPVENNLPLFLLMVTLAWTTIAFGEELFYCAFLISRLIDHTSTGKWAVIVISGLLFGVVHFAEGPLGILSNGAFGVFFAWIYIRVKRNLWITIIAHGLLNTLRFVLLFVGAV